MAQPDLVTQKIVGTDPQVGFGEGDVLPYRRHVLDTGGLDAMERARTRIDRAKEERKKDNEDFLNQGIKNLNTYDRSFQEHMDRSRQEVLQKAYSSIKGGKYLKSDPNFINAFTKYQQDAEATNQIAKERDKIMNLGQGDLGKYVNVSSYKGAALKNYDEVAHDVNAGKSQSLQNQIAPDPTDPEHFKFDEFIHDKTKDIKGAVTANDTLENGALGQLIKHNERGYKFYTRDQDGNIVPGIDKSLIDHFLNTQTDDQDMLQFRTVMENLADKHIENKALQLKQNDPAYADMGVEKIKEKIAYDPANKNYVNKDALKERILKEKLEPYQETTEKNGIRNGHRYDTGSGSGASQDEINARHQSIKKILTGDATEKGNLTNGVYGGKKVVDVEFSQQQPDGRPVKKSAQKGALKYADEDLPGVIKFKVEGEKGKIIEVQKPYKDKNELYYILNNVYNTSPGQNKISKEELDKNRGNDSKVEKDADPFKIKEEDQTEEDIL